MKSLAPKLKKLFDKWFYNFWVLNDDTVRIQYSLNSRLFVLPIKESYTMEEVVSLCRDSYYIGINDSERDFKDTLSAELKNSLIGEVLMRNVNERLEDLEGK